MALPELTTTTLIKGATPAAEEPRRMPRFCDIIMKGGITSGIVYPAAVYEIAKDFVFKNVGGTSAGAIAAALTAAAERRRARDGSMEGFARVNAVPDYLAKDQHLYHLFTPTASTRSLYRTIVSLAGRPRFQPAWLAQWCGLVWAYPVASIIGALVGALFLLLVTREREHGVLFAVELLAPAITIIVGITIAIAWALVRDVLGRLPRNNFGMVKGIDDTNRASLVALCTWLTQELELTAGLEAGKSPLTFGMLWDAKQGITAQGLAAKPLEPDVNLEMVTTNVTWGRPYQFPTDRVFYYDPVELRDYFPDHVLTWMSEHPRQPKPGDEAEHFAAYKLKGKLPLPAAADLPVIVATRMSLAFPILLSAVPLYAADYSLKPPPGELPELEHCWFSDGGISSNFPITIFDSPLPRWPTFAINLAPFPPAHPQQADESKNVYMPASNSAGTLLPFDRFTSVPNFLSAILDAMQNWNDNTQTHLPGYRDRIVTVFLSDKEGGLNLDMPPDVLKRLRLRGAAAGALIAGRFKEPSTLPPGKGSMNWENHRWSRFRSTMGALKTYLKAFATAMQDPQPPDVPYDALIMASDGTPAHRYPIAPDDRAEVDAMAKRIEQAGIDIAKLATLDDELPKPPPLLTLRASLDT